MSSICWPRINELYRAVEGSAVFVETKDMRA